MTEAKPESWERLQALFKEALQRDVDQRAAFIGEACGGDRGLQARLQELLAAHQQAEQVLGSSAASETARLKALEGAAASIPRRIGHYHLKRIIATGGMGTVYEATQEKPRRTVAVKVMRRGIASRSALRRFEYESQLLARLRHPGIAQVYEAGTHDDPGAPGEAVPYFAMEYIPNAKPITEYAEQKKLRTRERLALFAKVCDAVHHGHQKGIIHRDLKPANILVDSDGRPKIIDFGVARSTDSDLAVTTLQTDVGQLIGTLQYMSPEQCEADPHDIDTRSDVYALGVVLYELLSGKLPYDVKRTSVHEATLVIREQPPTRLSAVDAKLRGDIETIVLKALEKERDRRYESSADFARDVRRYLNNEPIIARPPSTLYQLHKFAGRNKALVGGVAAVFVVLVAGIITTSWQAVLADQARTKAENEKALAEAVYEFMHHTLTAFEPGHHEVTLREVLDGAAKTIDSEFPDQPLVEAEVRNMIQGMYVRLGEYDLAEPHAREMAAIRRRELGDEDPQTLAAMSLLGLVFLRQHKYAEAEPLYRRILDSRRRVLGEEHQDTLQAISNLAQALLQGGRADEAEPLARQAVEASRRIFGDEHEETLTAMNNLALVLENQGKLAEAGPLFERVLEIERRTLGNEHPHTISNMHNLAWYYVKMDKPAQAEPLFREAVEMGRRVHGEEHRNMLYLRHGLGQALRRMRRFDEAEKLFRQVLDNSRSLLGNEHPGTLMYMNNLAVLLQKTEKLPEAEPLLREVLQIRRRTQGDEHPATLVAMSNLAWQLWKQGELAEAEPLFDQAIGLYRQVRGEEHPDTLHALNNYAGLLADLDRPAEAEKVYRQVLEARRRLLGDEDPKTLETMTSFAALVLDEDRPAEAEPLFRKVLESDRRKYGEEHSDTVGSMVKLASALRDMQKLDEAAALYRQAIELAKRVLPADDRSIPRYQSAYGTCLTMLERYEEAEEQLLAGYEGLKEAQGEEHKSTRKALQRLVKLYEAWDTAEPGKGYADKAAEWRAKLPAQASAP